MVLNKEIHAVWHKVRGKRKYYLLARACAQTYETLFRAHGLWKLWEYAELFADLNVPLTHMLKRVRAVYDDPKWIAGPNEIRMKLYTCVAQLAHSSFSFYGLPFILKRMKALAINKPTGEMFEGRCYNFYRCVFGKNIGNFNDHQNTLFHAADRTARPPFWIRWRDCLIPNTAQAIYDEKRFEDLPILADMMEDAGVDDPEMTSHFRIVTQHCRGCWPLDLLIGRS